MVALPLATTDVPERHMLQSTRSYVMARALRRTNSNKPKRTQKKTDLRHAVRALIDKAVVDRAVENIVGLVEQEITKTVAHAPHEGRAAPRLVTRPSPRELAIYQRKVASLKKARAAKKEKRLAMVGSR